MAVLAAVLLAAFVGVFVLPSDTGVPAFDPAVWRAQAAVENSSQRFAMIPDLEAGKLRAGMTREEVRALLGPPDRSEPGFDWWGLGLRPFGMDYESYIVRYGSDGRVTGFGRIQS